MPRKTISFDEASSQNDSMTEKLRAALTNPAESGQPMIYEQELAPGRRKIAVVWDDWHEVPLAKAHGDHLASLRTCRRSRIPRANCSR